LIADEPTTALDVSIQKEIMDLLKDLQRKIGLSILIVTHDLNLVEKFADDIFVMNNGKIVEFGSSKQIFNKPEHKYTKKLIKASKGTPLDKDELASDVILKIDNLSVEYKNGVKAVKNVSFKVRRGATLAIIGESGSGKTSILNAILRLISVRSGEAYFNKNNIFSLKSKDLRQLRRKMQIVFQDPFSSLSPRMSISQIIEEPLKVHKIGNKITRKQTVDKVLKEVGLPLYMKDKYPHEFSGGQRQRVAIARALILNPELLILDEPTSALDVCVQEEIINLLNDIQKDRGLSYIFVSHDLKLIKNIADYVIVLKNGAIIEQNIAKKLFFQPIEKYTKKLLSSV
jgi:microcin C transport system ATP-binding protein